MADGCAVMVVGSALLALLLGFPIAQGETPDCLMSTTTAHTGFTHCSTYSFASRDYFLCGPGLECCDDNRRSCCFSGSREELYTTGEILGLTLCSSALVMTGFLTLVICCATFCNNKDDKTAWQKG